MANYDEYRALAANASTEQKVAILRSESKRVLTTLHGFAILVHKLVEERGVPQMPPDFIEWCKRLVNDTEELTDLIEGLFDQKHRDILRKEREDIERNRAEEFWKEEQAEFPELQNYSSFIEAVKQTAAQLNVSIPGNVEIINVFYPSVMSVFSTTERRVNIQAVLPKHNVRPFGYAVILSELAADELNTKGPKHEGSTKSLHEVVLVLYHWLVDKWDLEKIRTNHEWMSNGTIFWQR